MKPSRPTSVFRVTLVVCVLISATAVAGTRVWSPYAWMGDSTVGRLVARVTRAPRLALGGGSPAPSPVVTATKVAAIVGDVSPFGQAGPGETIRYTVTVAATVADATGVHLVDSPDANTTFVGGSIVVSPIAFGETYASVGNMTLSSATIGATCAGNVLHSVTCNDSGTSPTLTGFGATQGTANGTAPGATVTTSNNGSVVLSADGTFIFNPAAGFEGADTFWYTQTNTAGFDNAQVTINVGLANGMVWFVSSAGGGSGRQANPMTLAAFQAVNNGAGTNPASGDTAFLFEGAQVGPVTLLNNQKLLGQDATLAVPALGGPTAQVGNAYPTINPTGTTVAITSASTAITLAAGNTIAGFAVGNSPTAILGGVAGTLNVREVAINTNGQGLVIGTSATFASDATFTGFTGITSSGGLTGISLTGVGGTLNILAGSISGNTSVAFNVNGGGATITFPGPIQNSGGRQVNIVSKTGGAVTFNGAVNGTGTGIFLNANLGTTINFTGGIALSTGATTAFTASGGGTVSATQNNTTIVNTLQTTTGTALNVTGTTIGASGLTFRSINTTTAGGSNGILLSGTGVSGGLTVTGIGTSAGSGGAINNKTVAAINLTSTFGTSLSNMTVQNNQGEGILGNAVNGGFSLTGSSVAANGTVGNRNGIRLTDTSGAVSFVNNTVIGNTNFNAQLTASGGSTAAITTLTVTGGSYSNSVSNGGFLVDLRNTATLGAAFISGATFSNNFSKGVQFQTNNNAVIGNSSTPPLGGWSPVPPNGSLTVYNCVFSNNNVAASFEGGGGTGGSDNVYYRFVNNGSAGSPILGTPSTTPGTGSSHTVIFANGSDSGGGTYKGFMSGNYIGNASVAGSGSGKGNGVRVFFQGQQTATMTIVNNVIRQAPIGRGIDVEALGRPGAGFGQTPLDVKITGNDVNPQDSTGFPLYAIYVGADAQGTGSSGSLVRAEIHGNTVPAPPGGACDSQCSGIDGMIFYETVGGATGTTTGTLFQFGAGATVSNQIAINNTGTSGYSCSIVNGGSLTLTGTAPNTVAHLFAPRDIPAAATVHTFLTALNSRPMAVQGPSLSSVRARSWPVIAKTFARASHGATRQLSLMAGVTDAILNGLRRVTALLDGGLIAHLEASPPLPPVDLDLGTVPVGKTIKVVFDVTVNTPPVAQYSNQGTVTWTNSGSVLTDDPGVGGASDPTTTPGDRFNTTTALVSSLNPADQGMPVTFTATVTPTEGALTPDGTVQFKDNGSNLGAAITCTAAAPTCTAQTTTSSLAGGTRSITADYLGGTNHDPSTSNTVAQVINVCTTNPVVGTNADAGAGSLRQAIADACAGSTISFGGGVVSPIGLTTGELTLTRNVTISGPGATLLTVQRASGTARVFTVTPGVTATLEGLTIANGLLSGSGRGAGIYNDRGTLTVRASTVTGNIAAVGGGIYSNADVVDASLTILNSTLSDNSATGQGGALYTLGIAGATSTVSIANTTISGNTADGDGGGVYSTGTGTTSVLMTMTNSTITNNRADNATGGTFFGGGVYVFEGLVTLRNTIVAGNFHGASPGIAADDLGGSVIGRFNLIGDGTGTFGMTSGVNGNQIGTGASPINPRLGALASNGGPTPTHALLAGSRALDAGDSTLVANPPFSGPPFTDQRGTGFGRIRDAADADLTQTVDVGAFEADPAIEDIADQATGEDTPLSFLFNVGDSTSAFAALTATSSNTTLLPNASAAVAADTASTRRLTLTPAANQSGTTTITVTATKTIGGASVNMSDTFVLTVNSVDDPPTLDAIGDPAAILEDASQQTVNLSGISAGPGESQAVTVTATSNNTALIPNPTVTYTDPSATGSLTYTPVGNASGSATITVTVTDAGALSLARTFAVVVTAVNDPPTLSPITDPSAILEDTGAQTVSLAGISAGGGETQTLTVTALSNDLTLIPNPTVTYASPDATGSLSYTPVANASGTAIITVTVSDGGSGTSSVARTFVVTVTAVNDPPTLNVIPDPSAILEDAGAQTVNLAGISAGGGETQTLTVTATSNNTALIPNPTVTYTSADPTGSLSFTPVADAGGTATITVTVTDDGTGTNTFARTFVVAVTAVNDPPTLTVIPDPAPMLEDAGAQTVNLAGISAGGGETQTLTVTATSNNTALIPNPAVTYATADATGSLGYTSVANTSGSATITVTVTDDGGGTNAIVRTFLVTVGAVADTPSVTNAFTPVNTQTTSGLVITRSAGDGAEVTHVKITAITGGALFQANGTTPIADNAFITVAEGNAGLRFTPATNSAATGHVTVQASLGALDSGLGGATVTADITVTKLASTTTVVSSIAAPNPGQPITFTATVAPAALPGPPPGGTVQFTDNGGSLGSPVALASGVATLTTSTLPSGTHLITAVYSGDPLFRPSTGTLAGGQLVKTATTTTLTALPSPSTVGSAVTLTAAVAAVSGPGVPAGTVTIREGATAIGSGPLSGGLFSVTTSSLTTGTHALTADYLGDATFVPSTGTLTHVVGCPVMTVAPATLPAGILALAYHVTFMTTGSAGTVTYGLTGALPAGLSLTGAVLSGTPAAAGTFPLTLTATDTGSGCAATVAYTLTIGGGRLVTVGTDAPAVSRVERLRTGTWQAVANASAIFAPFPGFTGGARVAEGDVTGDGVPDILVANGPGLAPEVRVFDGSAGTLVRTIPAGDPADREGLFVAAGDVDGDGRADIVTGAGGGPPVVRVFSGASGAPILSVTAFGPDVTGGVRVAAGDVTGDGFADLILATGPGSPGQVRILDGQTHAAIRAFSPYPGFTSGAWVAAGDVDGDGFADIITGADAGGGPHVRIFDGRTGVEQAGFFAGPAGYTGGVRVAAGDVNGDEHADIITVFGADETTVRVFDGVTHAPIGPDATLDVAFTGGTFVSTAVPANRMVIDTPVTGADLVGDGFTLAGWALQEGGAGTGVDAIHVWAYPAAGGAPIFLGAATLGIARADIAAIFGPRYAATGYTLAITGLPEGTYEVVVFAHSAASHQFNTVRTVRVTMRLPAHDVRLVVDVPSAGPIRTTFRLAGWALDARTTGAGTGIEAVHIWAARAGGATTFLGAATLGDVRPDVETIFGPAFAAPGYHLDVTGLADGAYTLQVFAKATALPGFTAVQTVAVTVATPAPRLRLQVDLPIAGDVSGPFRVAGWALVQDGATAPGVDAVHVWAYPLGGGSPQFLGVATLGLSRPDVGDLFGAAFTPSGFNLDVSGLALGTYDLAVFARPTGGAFGPAQTVRVTVR